MCADGDPDAELARPPRDDVRLDAVHAEDGQQRDAAERREHASAGSKEPHVETRVEMIPPCRDTEDRHALVDIAHDAGDRVQHGPFVTSSHPKLERHRALVVLSERHVDVRVWPGITERVLDRRDDADHQEWPARLRSLGVEELNQPSECASPGQSASASASSMIATRSPEPGASSASLKSRPPSMGSPRTRA